MDRIILSAEGRLVFWKSARFNLVELLLMFAILLVLASLMMPSLQKTVNHSLQVKCLNQLRTVSHGFTFFALDHDNRLPYASWNNNSQRVFWGWDDFIQPYLVDETLTQSEIDSLRFPVHKGIEALQCPASIAGPLQDYDGLNNNYAMPVGGWSSTQNKFVTNATTGLSSVEPEHRPLLEIEDPGHTLLLAEMDVKASYFIQGIGNKVMSPYLQVQEKSGGVQLRADANYSLLVHQGDLSYLFVDGHVEANFYNAPALIGAGTPEKPKGAWTIDPLD